MAGLRDKAIEESEKALLIYKDNSYALVLQASLTVDDDSIKAESMFKKALQLADTQFVGDPRQRQLQIKINAYLGLGYVYYKRTIYDIAEKYCCNALVYSLNHILKLLYWLTEAAIGLMMEISLERKRIST